MIIYPISAGIWDVYAVADADGNCQVMAALVELQNGSRAEASLGTKMRQLLENWLPSRVNGPQTHNLNIAKKLTENIYEFKKGAKKGPKIRVLWFYGNGKQVICTLCFLKTNKVERKDLKNAEDLRTKFFKDFAVGNIAIIGD